MLNRSIVSESFMYKTNEYNFRQGFLEENTVKRNSLFVRIDHWCNVFKTYLKLQENDKIMLYFNQNSLDTIAIYFAVMECDLNLVEQNADILLHTLADSQLEKLNFESVKTYNYFDLADIKFNSKCTYEQKGTSVLYNQNLLDISINKKFKIKGNVLHTKYLNTSLFFDFFLPVMSSDKISFHSALGYTNVNQGLQKIASVIQKLNIDNIVLPNIETINELQKICQQKNIELSNKKIITYDDNGLCYNFIDGLKEIEDDFLKKLPAKYNIDGKILKDGDDLYFQFNFQIDKNIAKTKVKSINALLDAKKYNKISKWAVLNQNDHDEALIIFRNLKW